MIPTEFATAIRVGNSVEVRWTNCNRHFRANAIVTKINEKTGVAKITHDVPSDHGGYKAGQTIKAPLPFRTGHTQGNGFWPVTVADAGLIAAAEKDVAIRRKFQELVGKAISGYEIVQSKPVNILELGES